MRLCNIGSELCKLCGNLAVLFLQDLIHVFLTSCGAGGSGRKVQGVRVEGEGELREFVLEALLLSLKLVRTVVRLVVLQAEVDKAVANLLDNVLALCFKTFPVNSYKSNS